MNEWKLVPVTPTQAMLDANGTSIAPVGTAWLSEDARQTWAAMLAAAPEDPCGNYTAAKRTRWRAGWPKWKDFRLPRLAA